MNMDLVLTGHVQQNLGMCSLRKKCGRTLSCKGLVKWNEIIKDHKNTSFDSLKPFSDSYSTIWDDLCGKFEQIATHSQWEGSHKLRKKSHASNQILCISYLNPKGEIEKSAPGVDSSGLDGWPGGWNSIEVANPAAWQNCLHFSIFEQKNKWL